MQREMGKIKSPGAISVIQRDKKDPLFIDFHYTGRKKKRGVKQLHTSSY
jgi:hypothetical protein